MTKTEIEEIVYRHFSSLGVNLHINGSMPLEEVSDERIIIIVGNTTSSRYWYSTQVKVNWCVPDINGEADTPKIKVAEASLHEVRYIGGEKDGCRYRMKEQQADTFSDMEMRCHVVNKTFNFQYQKLMNYE